jgi:hypothetical protein
MLSLLIDPDEDLIDALQQQTRGAKREAIQKKEKETARRRDPKLAKKPSKAEFSKIRMREEKREADVKFADHCYVVAQMITRIAIDIEQLVDDEKKWFENRDQLVDALARHHSVADKFRAALSAITRYERRVINGALELCVLDRLLAIERCGEWVRLHALDTTGYICTNGRQLRAA